MAKANKELTTRKIFEMAGDEIRSCTKLQMDNIVFPKWEDLGIWGMAVRQMIRTKEQPEGCLYSEDTYRVVLRILSGRLFGTGNLLDAYTWKHSKVENAKNKQPIGTASPEAVINLAKTLQTIVSEEDKRRFAEMFCIWNLNYLLITTPEESRYCIEITQELYDAGLTYCVDEWMETDSNDEAEITTLNVGDFLIVSERKDSVYCIRHDEFVETHSVE